MVILQAKDLWVEKTSNDQRLPVLRGVNLAIQAQRVTALFGESGAGKTILARALAGLLPDDFNVSRGGIWHREKLLAEEKSWAEIRGREIFYAPQNAAASLNPVLTIGRQIGEYSRIGKGELLAMLAGMQFADPERILNSYPFALSGGENQRCLLALALAGRAELLILDEPTAELDALAQDEFVRVLKKYQGQYSLSILLISHQLEMIKEIAQSVYAMHQGEVVGSATAAAIFDSTCQPVSRKTSADWRRG
jgi:ABC-type glutathione transport system ATPase component